MREIIQRPDTLTPEHELAASAPAGNAGGMDIRRYIYMIARRLWLLLICFFASIVIMLVMMMRQEPQFQAVAKLQLTRSVGLPANLQQRDMETIVGDYAQTQRTIILSTNVILKARNKLGLTAQEFDSKASSLTVQPGWQTAILSITVTSLDPVFCADYANAIAEAYVEYKREERSGSSQDTAQNLSNQAKDLAVRIEGMENDLLAFVRENSVVGIQERGNVAASLLARLSSQSAEFRTQRMLLEAQQPLLAQASDEVVLATLEYGLASPATSAVVLQDGSSLTEGVESLIDRGVVEPPHWDTLKREKAILEAQLVSYRKKYKDAHPLIQETLRRLQENEDAIKVEIQFALKQYYSQLEALNIKERAAQRVEAEWEEQALEIDRKQKEYEGLQRNMDRAQRLYELILNRLQEVDISAGIQLESVRILERALVPGGPIQPRNLQSLFLAALIGLALGVGLIFMLEFMDDSIRAPEDVPRALQLNFLGLIPSAHWKQEREDAYWIGNVEASSGFAESYRNIRSALLLNPSGTPFKTITVVSSVPKEGKTTTCANLATSFAQSGYRVLAVDADFHRGGLHRLFGLQAGRGFAEILMETATLDQVLQPTKVPGLDLVGTGTFPVNPAELVLRPSMKAFLDQVAGIYDYVFIDAPPVLAVSEATVISSQTDVALMVVWSGRTSRKLVQNAIRQLLIRGTHLIGCVLNNLDVVQMGYYGASSYYPYYGYDYRYEEEPADDRKDKA
ncbi:MAG: polysaccharide biosynthesis tyrosine autokinase [Verrucomicrobiota bacterium]|jgi:capsular exopolysaccharide synthesis family protein|nr:polysaccharide biosynthesis tyrosine autokinase [Verrucomicrobiota bacterium]